MEYEDTQNTANKQRSLRGRFTVEYSGRGNQVTMPKKLLDKLGEDRTEGMIVVNDRAKGYVKLSYFPKETFEKLENEAAWQEDNEDTLRMLSTAVTVSVADGKLTMPKTHREAAEIEPGIIIITGGRDHINIYGAEQHQIQQNLSANRNIYDQPEWYRITKSVLLPARGDL